MHDTSPASLFFPYDLPCLFSFHTQESNPFCHTREMCLILGRTRLDFSVSEEPEEEHKEHTKTESLETLHIRPRVLSRIKGRKCMREDRKITTKNTPSLTGLPKEKGHQVSQVISCMFDQRQGKVKEKGIHQTYRKDRKKKME